MDITEDNYVAGLQAKNEKALKFFIEHDGWIVKSIVHKMMAKYQDKQEECMNDIFLAVWMMWSLLGIRMSKVSYLMRKKCWNSKSCWRFCRRKTDRYSLSFSGTKKAMRKSGRR